jgi:hypothetical protein
MAAKLPNLRVAALAAEAALVILVLVLHVAGWFGGDYLKELGTPGRLLAEALPFASLSLLALWIPLGPGTLWLRGAASPLLAWLLYQAAYSKGPTDWTSADKLLVSVAVALFVAALGLRLCGVRVMPATTRLDVKAPQFSVRGLLIVTTLVALCIGGLEAARPWLNDPVTSISITDDGPLGASIVYYGQRLNREWFASWINEGGPRHALMSAILILTSVPATWAVLRPGAVWLRAAGVAICLPAAGLYLGQLTSLDRESTLTITLWICAISLVAGLSVAPLRLMGYRVVRPCIAATSGRAERTPIHGSSGASPSQPASPSQSLPSEHALAESNS